jgi:2-methylfumaryl-CoA isomerase
MTGPDSGDDAPVNHVLAAWDLLTGAYAAFALLAALRHRDATGLGQEVRIPLQDVATASVANMGMIAEVLTTGANRPRMGNAVFGAFGRDFRTRDGERVMIMAITPKQWRALVDVLNIGSDVALVEAREGISFATDEGLRFIHRHTLFTLVERAVATRDWAELETALSAAGACYGAYQTMLDAAHDPKLVGANPIFAPTDNPSGTQYPAAGAIATLPAMQRGLPGAAPVLGQDTAAILARLLG